MLRAKERRRTKNIALDYFISVIAKGGPQLTPLPPPHHIEVGDALPILVGLHYPDRTVPANADIRVTVTGPKVSIRDLVTKHGLVAPPGGPDPVNAWTATLQQIAAANGGDIRSLALRAPSSQAGWTIRLRGILQFLGAVPWKAAMAAFAKSWRRE